MTSADLHRRGVLGGALTAAAVGLATPGRADDPVPSIQLRRNLFTRVSGPAYLNGFGPFNFVIDTGAGATTLGDHLPPMLGLAPDRTILVHGITGPETAPSATVDRLVLGGESFRDLRCPVMPRERLGADGLIGLDVLGRFRLRFDIRRQAASLTQVHSSLRMGGATILASRLRGRDRLRAAKGPFGQLITTSVEVDQVRTAAFVDSGAQYSIGNLALLSALTGTPRPAVETVRVYGVTGQVLDARLQAVRDLRLGPTRLGETPLLFADLHAFATLGLRDRPALVMGADLLGRFREVTLDFHSGGISFSGLQRAPIGALEA